ncbi:MAG: hypothetical protein IIA27_06910, partial [Gemmatimonadetes bacterium]|nr:hypothetical protein [Gemmatimonadota bacterium]
ADITERLSTALADRYTIERELGAGGLAQKAVRRYGGNTAGALEELTVTPPNNLEWHIAPDIRRERGER